MIEKFTRPAALAATGGLLAAGLALVAVLPQDVSLPEPLRRQADDDAATRTRTSQEAPATADLEESAEMAAVPVDGSATGRTEAGARAVPAPAQAPGRIASQGKVAASPPVPPSPAPQAEVLADGFAGAVESRSSYIVPPQTEPMPSAVPEADTEAFPEAEDNPVRVTAEYPVSTFSVDVDTASWAVARSSILAGALPPKDAVRVEEMVNYFPYAYPAPEAADAPFRADVTLVQTPWNPDTQLLRIGLQGRLPAMEERPPLNLVLLIDTSGSMNEPDKLPLLKQAMRLMLPELRPGDEVAIVTYAGAAGIALEPVDAGEREAILAALDSLKPGGGTAGQAGLAQAYAVAEGMAAEGEVSRILLATDGDFNIGPSDPDALKDYVAEAREDGTYLSVLGFGRGNLDDATMQALAQNGNGTAAYVDTLQEAQKVLVDQLAGALFPIADDVKVQVEFNPATVEEYRLIGYETRALRREDFANDRIDAGEIGAGHQVTALYEITPPGSPALLNAPLRYAAPQAATGRADELGLLRLRYKAPGESESHLIETPIPAEPAVADVETTWAAAVAGFAQLLRDSPYLGDWSMADAVALARGARGDDPFGYRTEAVRLMRLAESIDAGR